MTVRRFEVIAKLNGRGFVCACDGLERWPEGDLLPTGAVCDSCGHLRFYIVGQEEYPFPSRTTETYRHYSRTFVLTPEDWERFCTMMGVQIYIPEDSCYHNYQIPIPQGHMAIDIARSNHGLQIAVKLAYTPPPRKE